jgi:hypothetical protein
MTLVGVSSIAELKARGAEVVRDVRYAAQTLDHEKKSANDTGLLPAT